MKVTYYGQSCFLVETSAHRLLFDPFISGNELARDIDVAAIECDFLLLSHGHQDHVLDAMQILQRTGAKLVSNFEIVTWYKGKGIENTHEMNIGGGFDLDFGRVKYVPALHSSMLPDGSYGGSPGGFVIQCDGRNFYYAGDTALTLEMKLLPEEFDFDFAFLPIGDNYTMGPKDAARATDFIQCKNIIGMHYDTFGYIKIDHEAAKAAFTERNAKLTLMKIGETIEL